MPTKKKKNVNRLRFSLIHVQSNPGTVKIVHTKSPVHDHDPSVLFLHRYKTVPTIKTYLSGPPSTSQIWSKYELYTCTSKPFQLQK